jgi:hypothetical protein
MDDATKRKYDALAELRKAAWDSFNQRRPFEWQVCIALWTAMAAFAGFVISAKDSTISPLKAVLTGIVAVAIVHIHKKWLNGLATAHNVDKDIEILVRSEMNALAGVAYPKPMTEKLSEVREGMHPSRNWNVSFQLAVTSLLALFATMAVLDSAFHPPKTGEEQSRMTQGYEYKVVEITSTNSPSEVELRISNVAHDGWILSQVLTAGEQTEKAKLIFQRPRK